MELWLLQAYNRVTLGITSALLSASASIFIVETVGSLEMQRGVIMILENYYVIIEI